jgi:hypothetical protein
MTVSDFIIIPFLIELNIAISPIVKGAFNICHSKTIKIKQMMMYIHSFFIDGFVGAFHGNLPHVVNIDNRPATALFRKSLLLCNIR